MALSEQEEFELLSLEREKALTDATSPKTLTLPANAGLGNFAASLIGLPMDTVQNAANLGIAAFGAGRQALTGKHGPDLINNIPGGSENVRNMMRSTGAAGLSPDNPTPNSPMGTAQYDFVSRGGVIPGGALSAAGSMIAERIGGPQWAGVGAMAPSAAVTGFNAARAAGMAKNEAQNVVRDATLKPAQDAGYVLPPSAINQTAVGNVVESFAGKAALRQEANLKNQQVTNSLVRKELDLPENTPLTENLLNKLRSDAAEPYRQVGALSQSASKALQALRDARAEAKDYWRSWDANARPEDKRQAVMLDNKANMLESFLERQATLSGKPELVPKLKDARTYIAKTYDIERALNVGDGNIDAHVIGRALDRGRPLSGNLKIIGAFDEAFKPFTREASKVPAPGVSALNWPAAAMLGFEGTTHFGPAGAAAAAIPFARGGVRSGILSNAYQRNFNRPDYTPNMQPQSPLEMLLQESIIQNQKQQ